MTKKEITELVMEGATGKYSHLIIYCDHWDYIYGYRYVKCGENINTIIASIKSGGSPGMFSIEEVYNYNLDLKKQINEKKAYHIEPISKIPKTSDNTKEKMTDIDKEIHISENLKKAIEYAMIMHKGQLRRDGTSYIKHPLSVVRNVLKYKKSKNLEILLISACLHDTIEDTKSTYYDIVEKFGPQVASIVLELTTDEDMKNILGKEQYLKIKMKNMSSWALVIKLCDRLDNISDLENCNDLEFKTRYINETISILDYILKNRKLSKTHIIIIEHIIYLLFKLCKDDLERSAKLSEILEACSSIKMNFQNSNTIYDKLLEVANYLDTYSSKDTCKKLIL